MKNIPLYEVRHIEDLRDMLKQSVELYADLPLFYYKKVKGGEYEYYTFKEYNQAVQAMGTGLSHLCGLGSRIALLAETRYEWYVSYLAVTNGTGVVVPIDKELPPEEVASNLNRAEVNCVIYSSSKQKVIDEIRDQIPGVKTFICMDQLEREDVLYFYDVLNQGQTLLDGGDRLFLDAPLDREAMTILLFTSGTTDKSKAVMLCHKNICKNLEGMCSMIYIDQNDMFLSVLPLHHTYECTCGFLCQIYRGSHIAICEGLRYIVPNMQQSKVSIILVVPLMLEKFHKSIMNKAKATKKMARKFEFGRKLSKFLLFFGIDKRKKIFKEVHKTFGGNLRLIICGGAAVDPQILQDMQDMGILCVQGYGLTECAPILAVNRDCDYNNLAAGLPMPDVDIQVIDQDENGIGEFIGKGDNVMIGYYQNEEATKNAIDENGYYHTGDLGYIDKNGFCIITGRKKNVIIAKNGKNVFPEEIETKLCMSDLVEECLVTGEEENDDIILTCTVFPNKEAVKNLLGADPDHAEVQKLIEAEVAKVNQNLVNYKHIKRVVLRDTEFEKTTSKKIKRQYKK